MKLPNRRNFLHLATGAAALPAISHIARAQAYPTRPVRIVVGLTAGSASDIVARLLGQWLSERLAQPFVIENRPGAGTNIAAEAVVRSFCLLHPTPSMPLFTTSSASISSATSRLSQPSAASQMSSW
jgi:tripartite-type tricarboxylate transporter receptor subunit TctC